MPKPNPHRREVCGELLELPDAHRRLLGQQFGRLEVIGFSGRRGRRGNLITCRCDCGWFTDILPYRLRHGKVTSCGCAHRDWMVDRNIRASTHGHASGGKVTPEYRAWRAMLGRCLDPQHDNYAEYGGRGITVCAEWLPPSFEAFFHDVGRRPGLRYSLDRNDTNGNYEPGNVRWATPSQQARNLRTCKLHELDGERKTLSEWAELYGRTKDSVEVRVRKYGWDLRRALTTPSGGGGRYGAVEEKPERERMMIVWSAIRSRCHDPGNGSYADYGGRGISMHPRWRASSEAFVADVFEQIGARPSKAFSLDRVDTSKGYQPGNLRWATAKEQRRNRRDSKKFEFNGSSKPIGEWAEITGLRQALIAQRLRSGWPISHALGTPAGEGRSPGNRRDFVWPTE